VKPRARCVLNDTGVGGGVRWERPKLETSARRMVQKSKSETERKGVKAENEILVAFLLNEPALLLQSQATARLACSSRIVSRGRLAGVLQPVVIATDGALQVRSPVALVLSPRKLLRR